MEKGPKDSGKVFLDQDGYDLIPKITSQKSADRCRLVVGACLNRTDRI
jgi:hypothetical protein